MEIAKWEKSEEYSSCESVPTLYPRNFALRNGDMAVTNVKCSSFYITAGCTKYQRRLYWSRVKDQRMN